MYKNCSWKVFYSCNLKSSEALNILPTQIQQILNLFNTFGLNTASSELSEQRNSIRSIHVEIGLTRIFKIYYTCFVFKYSFSYILTSEQRSVVIAIFRAVQHSYNVCRESDENSHWNLRLWKAGVNQPLCVWTFNWIPTSSMLFLCCVVFYFWVTECVRDTYKLKWVWRWLNKIFDFSIFEAGIHNYILIKTQTSKIWCK